MPGQSITQEEFDAWVPWPAAYRQLADKLGYEGARDAIRRGLLLATLRAAARKTIWEHAGGPEETRHLELLSRHFWLEGGVPSDDMSVWTTGAFDVSVREYQGPLLTTFCQGLRLEQSGLDLILSDAGITASTRSDEPLQPEQEEPAPPVSKGRLTDARLEAWAAIFNEANPGASEAIARKSVDAMFPNSHVDRQRLRRVLPQRRPGRPLKREGK